MTIFFYLFLSHFIKFDIDFYIISDLKMDPHVKTSIEQRLIESGEKERLKVMKK